MKSSHSGGVMFIHLDVFEKLGATQFGFNTFLYSAPLWRDIAETILNSAFLFFHPPVRHEHRQTPEASRHLTFCAEDRAQLDGRAREELAIDAFAQDVR